MSDLESRIRDYYESQEPPAEAFDELRAKGLAAHVENRRRRRKLWAVSLSAAAAVLLGFFIASQYGGEFSEEDRRSAIAGQISKAHLRHPPGKYQFESVDFSSLERTLERLNFPIAEAEEAIRKRFDLSGCNYCKIVANLALHFNAQDRETSRTGSLYVTALSEDLDTISPGLTVTEGVELEMWDDGERFFVFASTLN